MEPQTPVLVVVVPIKKEGLMEDPVLSLFVTPHLRTSLGWTTIQRAVH
jgi:hypothetical protein